MWTHPNKKTPEFPSNNNALSDNETYKMILVCYKHINDKPMEWSRSKNIQLSRELKNLSS